VSRWPRQVDAIAIADVSLKKLHQNKGSFTLVKFFWQNCLQNHILSFSWLPWAK